jgi:hypothetical protein
VWGFVLCGCTASALDNVPGLSLPGQKRVCIYVAAGVYFSQSGFGSRDLSIDYGSFFFIVVYVVTIFKLMSAVIIHIALYVWYLPRRSRLEQLVLILDACGPTVRG